jgi:GTP-binding protein
MFIDEATITVSGGDGGAGCRSFRREARVPRGGPDGGDGGAGGSVVLEADPGTSTLLAFRYQSRFQAERGQHGQGSNKTGRSGADVVVAVPIGTVVFEAPDRRQLCDLTRPHERFVVARGGRGGRGNSRFTSSVNQTPTRHDPGEAGERRTLRLELKLLADVGLLGFPNAGKSTFLARVSAARPKIADYPFTTLEPVLGVVDLGAYSSAVLADIPGLIEGAHRGAGLGLRFLRHVERCRLLLHLVDATDPAVDPVAAVEALNGELRSYRQGLERMPQILVATKADVGHDAARIEALRRHAAHAGWPVHAVSAVSGAGLAALLREIGRKLQELRGADGGTSAARTGP